MNARVLMPHQLFFIIVQSQVGIGILSLPYALHEKAGKDAWISVLIAGLFVQIAISILIILASRFPGKTFYEYVPIVLGKWLGKALVLLYTAYFFLFAFQVLGNFMIYTSIWVFPQTPLWVFALLASGVSAYLVRENIQIIARFYVMASFLLVGVFAVFLFMWPYLKWENLLPLGSAGIEDIMKGSLPGSFSLSGFEILLWLFPFVQASKSVKWKVAAAASAVSTVVYAVLSLFAFAIFSTDQLKVVPEPVIYMVKSVELDIIERIDLLFLSIWAVFAMTSFMSNIYLSATGMASLIKAANHRFSVYTVTVLIIPAVLLVNSPVDMDKVGEKLNFAIPIFLFLIPFLIWTVALIRKKKEDVY